MYSQAKKKDSQMVPAKTHPYSLEVQLQLEIQFESFLNGADEFIDCMYFEMEAGYGFRYVVSITTDGWFVLTNEDEFFIFPNPTISFAIPKPEEIEYVNSRYSETKRAIRKKFNTIMAEFLE
jgi:hypothetical protein